MIRHFLINSDTESRENDASTPDFILCGLNAVVVGVGALENLFGYVQSEDWELKLPLV